MWTLKNETNECNRRETDSQMHRTNEWSPAGEGKGRARQTCALRDTNYYVQNK